MANISHEIRDLEAQAARARETLNRLRQAVADAQQRVAASGGAQLVEANEQLVLAALRAQTESAKAAHALKDVSNAAELDPLTGLPLRPLLLDRFARAIANAKRRGDVVAVLFVDLNGFKHVNDTLGHAVGDELLKAVGRRLSSAMREADTVCRYGGDEFLILLADLTERLDATVIATKTLSTVRDPYRIGSHQLTITASIGMSTYPQDGDDAATLIDRADVAMYRAKRDGRGFVFYSDDLERSAVAKPDDDAHTGPQTSAESAPVYPAGRHEQLKEANEELVIAALGAQALQFAAEESRQRQTDFLAMLAHELRNPLTPIRNAAAVLTRGRKDKALLNRVHAIIERQVLHMSRLVDDLTELSRLRTGKLTLIRGRLDMTELIHQAVDMVASAMASRKQHFTLDLKPGIPLMVEADAVRVVQMLANLLDNASKYTPEGGSIDLSATATHDSIVIAVTDTGKGITAEAMPTIFEAFVHSKDPAGPPVEGLGIGLAIVSELAQAHGGSIVATSAGAGRGSRFVLTLPSSPPVDKA
jgi:diguanylate cyclase